MILLAALILMYSALPAAEAAAKETHTVSTADELESAVKSARAGDIIEITQDIPITHCFLIREKRLTIRSAQESGVRMLKRTDQYFGSLLRIEESDVVFEHIIIDGNKSGARDRTECLLSAADSGITLGSGAALQNNFGIGVRAENCDFVLSGGIVRNNLGGFWLDDSDFTMTSGEIIENESMHRHGGGVYLRYGKFSMSGGEIRGNSSENTGGGVTIECGTGVLSGGAISGNRSFFGGGVSCTDGTFTMTGGTISGNTGEMTGGGIELRTAFEPAALIISGGSVTLNTSEGGGGAAIMNDAEFRLSGGTIRENKAEVGGGVFFCGYDKGGKYVMTGGEIADNEAFGEGPTGFFDHTIKGAGGGVYQVGERSVFQLKDGSIQNNIANHGAGIYIEAGKLEMTGGSVTNNAARISDGGVFDRVGGFRHKGGTVGENADRIDMVAIDEQSAMESLTVGTDTGMIRIEDVPAFKELLFKQVLIAREKKAATIGDPVTVRFFAEVTGTEGETKETAGTGGEEKARALRFRVRMSVKTADGEPRTVSKSNGKIPVTLLLPKELAGGSYAAVHAGGGETVYEDMDNEPDTFTILTDLFSDYVLLDRRAEGTDGAVTMPAKAETDFNMKDPPAYHSPLLTVCIGMLVALLWIVCYSIRQLKKLQ